jgi:hypothetical protein
MRWITAAGAVSSLVLAMPTGAAGQEASPSTASAPSPNIYSCLGLLDQQLRSARVLPERYQLAVEGSCLDEELEATTSLRRKLEGMDHSGLSLTDARSITNETVRSFASDLSRARRSLVGSYIVWYETAPK